MVRVGSYSVELIPSTTWGRSLYHLSRKKGSGFRGIWDKIRQRELARAGNKCEICGVSSIPLICNEKWSFQKETLTQKLVGYEMACRDCDAIDHIGRTFARGFRDFAVAHFTKVTGLSESDLDGALKQVKAEWQETSQYQWHIDISYEVLARGYEQMINDLPICTSEQ